MNIQQPITTDFNVEIVRIEHDGSETPVALNLAMAITSWERELDDDDEDDDNGFLVSGSDDADDEDEDHETEGAEDDEDEVVVADQPEATLYLKTLLNKGVLDDIRELTSSTVDCKIRFVYGSDASGRIVREFDISSDGYLTFNSGDRHPGEPQDTSMQAHLIFDVYGSDTLY